MAIRKKMIIAFTLAAVLPLGLLSGCFAKDKKISTGEIVNVYSARNYTGDKIIYEAFEKKTGIRVNLTTGKASELLEELIREGEDTEADLFITADIIYLNNAIEYNITKSIESKNINENVPQSLRGKNNEWIGITTRARAIAYNKEYISRDEISTFEDLASDKWKGKIVTRSSDSLYSQSLLGSIIDNKGEEKARVWAEKVVGNFARKPEGNDKDQIKSISKGEGEIAIVNAHYVGCMLNSEELEEVEASKNIGVVIPKDTSINISGVVQSKYSKNSENAVKLIEFITDEKAQQAFSDNNYEYPVNRKAKANKKLLSWGDIKIENVDLEDISQNNRKAEKIFKEVGWE